MNTPITALLIMMVSVLSSPFAAKADSPPAAAKSWVFDMDKGSGIVMFDAIGRPSALKIHAKGDAPKGKFTVSDGKASGTATFKLDSLDTGISMRNEHMKKKYLETGKFPEAKLTLSELNLPANYSAPDFSASDVPFKGTLSIHGVEKPVSGTAKLSRSGEDLSIDARFALKIDDFAIKPPSFAGVSLANDVNCEIEDKAPFKAQ